MSDSPAPRKADLLDAMILVAAFVVGLAMSRRILSTLAFFIPIVGPSTRAEWSSWMYSISDRQGTQYLVTQDCVELLCYFAVSLTPAILIWRLRHPRPPFRQLAFQPGFVAIATLCVASLICFDLAAFDLVSISPRIGVVVLGASVLILWVILLATGRWLPDGSWIDRAGALTGVFWMATACWMIWVIL